MIASMIRGLTYEPAQKVLTCLSSPHPGREPGRGRGWRRLLATVFVCVAAVAEIALPGTANANPEIGGPEADRIRQQVCPDDLISTATHYRVFRDHIVVGRFGTTNEYGFDGDRVGTLIGDVSVAGFPRPRGGSYGWTLSQRYSIHKISVENGTLRVVLHRTLTAGDRRGLAIRVCGQTLRFSTADQSPSEPQTYTWHGVKNQVGGTLSWRYLNLASMYTGRPVVHPRLGIETYGNVTVSLGVDKSLVTPYVTKNGTVNGTELTLVFGQNLDSTKTPAGSAFSVRVPSLSDIPRSVPRFVSEPSGLVRARTVSNVAVSGSTVTLTLDAAPPKYQGNFKPGLGLSYTPPATNPLTGSNGTEARSIPGLYVDDISTLAMGQTVVAPPEITGTPALSASPRTDGTWTSGDTVEATLTFTEAVTVDTTGGTPSVTLQLGGTTEKTAGYLRGSGTTAVVFGYTLTGDDGTHTAMALDLNSLTLNGGTIRGRTSGLDALLDHAGTAVVSPPPQMGTTLAPVIIEDDEPDATVVFENAPASHDGAGEFTVELRFSEESQGVSRYATVRDNLLDVPNATILGARRLMPGSNLGWEIRVRPSGTGAVTLTLPVRPCGAANAVCVDDAPLGAAVTATIPYAATQTPLTAQFNAMPAVHYGGAFTFELALSEDVRGLGYERVRDSALTVAGGTVDGARRLVQGENRRWEVQVSPSGLGDVTVALAATQDCSASGAICTPGGRKQSTSTSATVRGPALSVADASVDEGSGAELAFAVTLGHAAGRSVSVDYATSDGTATAGADYTATSGTLTFAAGETSKTVSVPVLDDTHDEGSETMTLTLSNPNPSSVSIADDKATGTIKNTDPMPKAWLAHFGRTMGSQVLEAVVERTDGGPSGSHLNVGGVSLGGGTPLADAEPLTPQDWLAKQMAEGADAQNPEGITLTGRDLLLGSSFHLVSQSGDGGGAVWSAWGRVSAGGFRAEVDEMTTDGDVVTGMLGFDAEWPRVLAGLLLAHSEGDGTYSLSDGSDRGTMESALTGVYPYARLRLGGRLSVWGLAGVGSGDLSLMRQDETIDTDLEMRLGAVGVRGTLLEGIGGYVLAVKSDVLWVDTDSDATAGLAAASARVSRMRLILEGGRTVTLASGAVLAPTVQVGLRHDGGDAETGTGVEVGAGLRYSAGMLSVDAQVRTLLAHEAGGYEEWGASGAIRLSPGASGLGPSLAVLPSWGAAGSGAERLWSQPDASALVPGGGVTPPAAGRVDAELGWGLPALRGRGVLTPYTRLALAADDGRSWNLGTRLALAESLDLRLEGSSRGGAAHDLTLRATLPW